MVIISLIQLALVLINWKLIDCPIGCKYCTEDMSCLGCYTGYFFLNQMCICNELNIIKNLKSVKMVAILWLLFLHCLEYMF